MTTVSKCLVESTQLAAAQTTIYTCPVNSRVSVDKFTGVNVGAAATTLTINVVAASGAAAGTNVLTSARTLAIGETFGFPEMIGQILEPGDFVSVLAGAATSINVRMSGRVIT